MKSRSFIIVFVLLLFTVVILAIIDLLAGSSATGNSWISNYLISGSLDNTMQAVLFQFRIPKMLTAILAGSALSVSGLQMQTIFRNPLAGPYVLGLSAGASLGVALLVMGFGSFLVWDGGNWFSTLSIVLAAWLGSGLVLFLVMVVSAYLTNLLSILILGILFGSAISAVVNLLQYFSTEMMLKSFIVWTMGSLGSTSMAQLYWFSTLVFVGFILSFAVARSLNVLLLGENYARSMGVNIKKTRMLTFLSTSILAGTVTAFCGPIGFIGIVVPHVSRMVFKTANHFVLIPSCILIGSGIMLVADLISQLSIEGFILPINTVTSLTGIPIIIWIIIRNRQLDNAL